MKNHVEHVSSKVSRRLRAFVWYAIMPHAESPALNRYTLQSCSYYLTMLMLRGGGGVGDLRGVLLRVTPPIEARNSNYITEEHLK